MRRIESGVALRGGEAAQKSVIRSDEMSLPFDFESLGPFVFEVNLGIWGRIA